MLDDRDGKEAKADSDFVGQAIQRTSIWGGVPPPKAGRGRANKADLSSWPEPRITILLHDIMVVIASEAKQSALVDCFHPTSLWNAPRRIRCNSPQMNTDRSDGEYSC